MIVKIGINGTWPTGRALVCARNMEAWGPELKNVKHVSARIMVKKVWDGRWKALEARCRHQIQHC